MPSTNWITYIQCFGRRLDLTIKPHPHFWGMFFMLVMLVAAMLSLFLLNEELSTIIIIIIINFWLVFSLILIFCSYLLQLACVVSLWKCEKYSDWLYKIGCPWHLTMCLLLSKGFLINAQYWLGYQDPMFGQDMRSYH